MVGIAQLVRSMLGNVFPGADAIDAITLIISSAELSSDVMPFSPIAPLTLENPSPELFLHYSKELHSACLV